MPKLYPKYNSIFGTLCDRIKKEYPGVILHEECDGNEDDIYWVIDEIFEQDVTLAMLNIDLSNYRMFDLGQIRSRDCHLHLYLWQYHIEVDDLDIPFDIVEQK